jgi:hypothetical protein
LTRALRFDRNLQIFKICPRGAVVVNKPAPYNVKILRPTPPPCSPTGMPPAKLFYIHSYRAARARSQPTRTAPDSTHGEQITKLHEQLSGIRARQPEATRLLGDRARYLDDLMNGINTGAVIPIPTETVLNLNSLQVCFSSRFVYGASDCFDLAREMIKKNPAVKTGVQPSFL